MAPLWWVELIQSWKGFFVDLDCAAIWELDQYISIWSPHIESAQAKAFILWD